MTDLGSIDGLYERQRGLPACCLRCDRWRALDLDRIVRQGKGSVRLPLALRCRVCGEVGQLQVRPPTPGRVAGGWINPPTG